MAALFDRIQSLSESYEELLWLRAQVVALTLQDKKKKAGKRRRSKGKQSLNRTRRTPPVRKRRSAKHR